MRAVRNFLTTSSVLQHLDGVVSDPFVPLTTKPELRNIESTRGKGHNAVTEEVDNQLPNASIIDVT